MPLDLFIERAAMARLMQVLGLLAILIQLSVAVIGVRAGQRGGWPVIVGILLVFAVSMLDAINKAVPGTFTVDLWIVLAHSAFVGQALLFAFAITLHVQAIKRERDEALHEQLAGAEEKLRLNSALVSSRRRFERARLEAEKSSQQLSAFSHDLRQPLATLRARLSNPASERSDADANPLAELDYLESLISREGQVAAPIERDADSALEVFPATVVLANVARMFSDDAAANGARLRVVPSTCEVHCDPIALLRVLNNLVVNAITHSKASSILLGCRRESAGLRIEVHDNGVGMTQAELAAAWRAGEKGDGSAGNGLGLAIVKTLCEEHGFALTGASKPGHGSHFCIVVPRG